MDYEITIKVDTNDADYTECTNLIGEEDLNIIRPLIKAISGFEPYVSVTKSGYRQTNSHNYPTGECYREDLGEKSGIDLYSGFSEEVHDIFYEYLPSTEHGFHTIERITVNPSNIQREVLL